MLVTRPLNLRADRVLGLDALPRIGLELLHAERDALGLGVEADDLDLDGLADGQRLGRMVDAPPGDVGDMQQAVDAAQIDEGAVIGDVLDHARENLAFLQLGDQLGARFGAALLQHGAARDHDVAARAIHLQDLERLRRAHQRADVAHRADIDLAAGQERHGAGEIDGEAALDAAEDDAGDALVFLEGLLERVQASSRRAFSRLQHGFAVLVFHALEIDLDGVADLDLGLLAGGGEFLERDAAFGFQSDIDEGEVVFDGDDDALEHAAFESVAGAERFFEERGESCPCDIRRWWSRAVAALAMLVPSLCHSRPTGCIRRS